MEYAKFVKSHPLPVITEKMKKKAASIQEPYNWEADNLYTADIVDDILVINTYRKEKGVLKHSYRHLYDGVTFATQRISDNKKLNGEINAYLSTYNSAALDQKSMRSLEKYFPDVHLPDIYTLKYAEDRIKGKQKLNRWQNIRDRIDQRMSCFGDPPQEFYDWINDKLLRRHFFYTYKRGKLQSGFCTYCRKEFSTVNVRHKGETICPHCGSVLECLSLGKTKANSITYRTQAAYVEEVIDNGEAAIAERTFSVCVFFNNFRKGVENFTVKTEIYEWVRSLYKADKQGLTPKKDKDNSFFYVYGNFHNTSDVRWCRPSDRSGYCQDFAGYIYPDNLNNVCSKINGIGNMDLAAVVPHIRTELYALIKAAGQVPALENLAKQGKYKLLAPVVSAGLYDFKHTAIAKYVSYTESSPAKFLRVDKLTFKEMGDISEAEYSMYMDLRKNMYSVDMETVRRYSRYDLDKRCGTVIYLLKENKISPKRFIGYIEKQSKYLHRKGKDIFEVYRDYSDMVKDVKMQRTESVIFPKDIQKEHDVLMKIKTDIKYSKQNPKLKKRGKILHTLDYNDGKFLIIAFDKADDFINESAKLGHCVKTYIDRCAKGETNIYGIRKVESPDEPYFTLTLDNNAKVTQNLGKSNCQPPDEVKKFVKRWEKEVISKQKEKFISKIKSSAA